MALGQASQFEGLIPVIDRKQSQQPYVVDGKNFLVKADGPVSGFGRELLVHDRIAIPEYAQSYIVNAETEAFIFTSGAILVYDETSNDFVPVFTFVEPVEKWPWSYAVVNGIQYFCRKFVGLVQYTPSTGTWIILTGGSIPANPVACTQSAGRLIVLADTIVAWSAIDNGTDFVTSDITGAGFQSLSILYSVCTCSPLFVLEYAGGFIVYTTNGMLRGEAVQTILPFRFDVISRRHRPVNAWCILQVEELEHVFLAKEGFFSTAGDIPKPWQPVFSEYVHARLLPSFDLNNINTLKLFFDLDRGWFVFSVSQDQQAGIFTKAYVLYTPTNKWGSFDKVHTGFINIRKTVGADINFSLGMVDTNGDIFKFNENVSDTIFPATSDYLYYYDFHSEVEYPVRIELGVYKFPTVIRFASIDESIFTGSGLYDLRYILQNPVDPEVPMTDLVAYETGIDFGCGLKYLTTAIANETKASLNAFIIVGPIRATENQTTDELSRILNLTVGMSDEGLNDEIIDWMLDFSTEVIEDWAALPDELIDWGIGAVPGIDYNTFVMGTIDGYTPWENQLEIPTLVQVNGKVRHMVCDVTGVFNLIEFSATEIDQAIVLKTLDLNVQAAGVLF